MGADEADLGVVLHSQRAGTPFLAAHYRPARRRQHGTRPLVRSARAAACSAGTRRPADARGTPVRKKPADRGAPGQRAPHRNGFGDQLPHGARVGRQPYAAGDCPLAEHTPEPRAPTPDDFVIPQHHGRGARRLGHEHLLLAGARHVWLVWSERHGRRRGDPVHAARHRLFPDGLPAEDVLMGTR